MTSREYYKVSYNGRGSTISHEEYLDNDTEFNANQFKLYDDFTTDLRINYNPLRNILQGTNNAVEKRRSDAIDSRVDVENGNHDYSVGNDAELLENEVMVDPWSSMDSTTSPLTDSGPSASEDCPPSTSSETQHDSSSPLSPLTTQQKPPPKIDKPRNLTLDLDIEPEQSNRRPHFLDEDYQPPSKSNIECRIPKPHFLDHSPSPDEFDEKSDITNPNFLDDDISECDDAHKKGALPKKQTKPTPSCSQERPRVNYRSTLHYGIDSARSTERDKRASQLYRGTWPGERDVWGSQDATSVRSFSSNGSAEAPRASSNIESKMECVYSLLSLLTLSPDNNADLSGPLLEMSKSVESCIAMRQGGCIPLLVQLIHSNLPRETRDRAAKALRNIIHTQTDDKAGRREARVWRLLEQVREYCYVLEDVIEARKEGKEITEDDSTKHPSQSVAALMKLSFDEEHRHVVCQLGGLQALAALVSGDQAAHGSSTTDNTCLTMRKYAGMTLTNLTFGDGNNKSLLCSFKEFMMALVDQLESPNDDMRQVTAAVLRNLSWRADTNSKQVLREVGAVKGLTQAAMSCQKEATLKSVLSALWNLTAHCSMNKVALCSVEGALGFLVDMLSYDSPTKTLAIIENAGGIMRNVSSHIAVREDYRLILRERNCLSVLLQHLKSPSLTVVSNSCGTLWNLSARCPKDQQFLWDHGAVPMLRSLIHSKHKMIAMGSSAALKNLLNSKPGKLNIANLDTTARNMNLPTLPTLGVRKQKALEQELDHNLAETCDNIEPATSPSTSNREEKNLERQIVLNLERQRMTSSSPLMGTLSSQISLSHSAHLSGFLSCHSTLLRNATTRLTTDVNRSDSKDSVTSTHSDTVFEKVMRTGKVPVPTPRNKDLVKTEIGSEASRVPSGKPAPPAQPPVPPPRSAAAAVAGYDAEQDPAEQPIDFSRKYSETKPEPPPTRLQKPKHEPKKGKKEFGDYQETDLDQPTDYSLRYTEFQSETGSDTSEPAAPSIDEDTIKHFATEGTPYETPVIFSTATSMSDLRVIGKDGKTRPAPKETQTLTPSDEKDTCSVEEPKPDNEKVQNPTIYEQPEKEKRGLFDTKFSSGMVSPEKPVNYCEEGTPGYFSRVSSLSSLGEPTEEDCLAKKNAMATINIDPEVQDCVSNKDKYGGKAVSFAMERGGGAGDGTPPPADTPRLVDDTPLMFSRTSSLGSLPDAGPVEDHGSIMSEVSRLPSGCMSESELPDSPGHSAPLSPRHHLTHHAEVPETAEGSECSGRAVTWRVEQAGRGRGRGRGAGAALSAATSLSSLTIDDNTRATLKAFDRTIKQAAEATSPRDPRHNNNRLESEPATPSSVNGNGDPKDSCKVYLTEDTPAILSKCGSNSNLSVLSIISSPNVNLDSAGYDVSNDNASFEDNKTCEEMKEGYDGNANDSSDSSNLSDAADLLDECIQKGIANVVKNKGTSECGSAELFTDIDGPYRSLPLPLRASTETVRRRQDNHNICSSSSPPPPLPPRAPRQLHNRAPDTCLPVKSLQVQRNFPPRADSLSSLSADSFGSTDRELFEQTVEAGCRSKDQPRLRRNKSLDRSDKIQHKPRPCRDAAFERNVAAGTYNLKHVKRLESDLQSLHLSRSPYSYHGDGAHNLTYHSRRSYRHLDEGPPSLPARIEGKLERSNSLSSLSNDSFGSTDKEVFERCVKMGMNKGTPRKKEEKRVRSDDRLEVREYRSRRRRERPATNALDKMSGEEYRKDRAILEEVIARGSRTKNVTAPPPASQAGGGNSGGCDNTPVTLVHTLHIDENDIINKSNESPNVGSGNTTVESVENVMDKSNEYMAPRSHNTTLESERKDELQRSNESYAEIFNTSISEAETPPKYEVTTLTRKTKPEWVDIKQESDVMKRSADTWNDNTCPDDVTFPTLSGSVHLVSSIRSDVLDGNNALPDLLEKSANKNIFARPDLTNKLERQLSDSKATDSLESDRMLENVPEPSFTSIMDGEQRFDSIATEIEQEASRLAAQLKTSTFAMETSVTSLTSLDLENVRPPSNLGSLLSLSASGQFEDCSLSKKSQKNRKKSLPVAIMVKRALSNSFHQGSPEHPDSQPHSFIENVKPPSEMEHLDMESSIISISSLVSEIADNREKTPIVFDLKQPVHEFPMCATLTNVIDLDKVNPPSLFDEIPESTLEFDQTTAHQVYDDCISNTLNVVTDIPSGSENCTPIPSDMSSVESTPKRVRDQKYLTPKEKRQVAKDRYQTYTITDVVADDTLTVTESEQYLTWTKSESDSRSDEYVTANSQIKSKRRVSAKQRRQEDRARYQTQTVDVHSVFKETKAVDPEIENLKQRLEAKRTIRRKRIEDAERFRTRTLSEDIPPSPTFVTKDANFENVETTTGYDSLSSNEPNHQQITDERSDETYRDVDSGHNDDDCELNSTQLQTYTKSFRNYLPVTESPSAIDLCVVNNLKNIEITASYRRSIKIPSSSDFASYEGDSTSDKHSDSDNEVKLPSKSKPKIIKPEMKRDASLDSNDSQENSHDAPKAIRGRKKALYVSPYRRSVPPAKKPSAPVAATPKTKPLGKPGTSAASTTKIYSAKPPPKSATARANSATTSPKKTLISPTKVTQKPGTIPLSAAKPLPLERQGTFTKEDTSKKVAEKKPVRAKPTTPVNTSPSRLPQLNRYRPQLKKANSNDSKTQPKTTQRPSIKPSASNHSLQSNDSGKTVTLAKSSRPGSTSSVNSATTKTKDVESKIAGLWKRVEQAKKLPTKPDRRVWIESQPEPAKLIRSSTFDGQPQPQQQTAQKQKTAIGITQIPKPKTASQIPAARKPTTSRVFTRKQINGQSQ